MNLPPKTCKKGEVLVLYVSIIAAVPLLAIIILIVTTLNLSEKEGKRVYAKGSNSFFNFAVKP